MTAALQRRNPAATAGVTLSLIGAVIAAVPVVRAPIMLAATTWSVEVPLLILGLVFSSIGLARAHRLGHNMEAAAGLTFGIIGFLGYLFSLLVYTGALL